MRKAEARFWAKVDCSGPCWVWTASTWNSGYGQFHLTLESGRQTVVGAHQFSYWIAKGAVPDGKEIMHSCDNRRCVRPEHLSVGTHGDNVRDASRKGHYKVPRPKRQKLTAAQVIELRELVTSGELQIRVAERFGVSEAYVSKIMQGKLRQYDAPLVIEKESAA